VKLRRDDNRDGQTGCHRDTRVEANRNRAHRPKVRTVLPVNQLQIGEAQVKLLDQQLMIRLGLVDPYKYHSAHKSPFALLSTQMVEMKELDEEDRPL
jgi:hypothetical protein